MVRLNVMVVDDSMLSQKKLVAMLEQQGHQVVGTAQTGAEALERYGDCNPDVVTMDITMPDMDGIEATRKLRTRYRDARIVMVTSHAQKSMVMDALDAGALGYLIKPIEADKLAQTLERLASAAG